MWTVLDWTLFFMAWALFLGAGIVALGAMSWVLYLVGKFWVDTLKGWWE